LDLQQSNSETAVAGEAAAQGTMADCEASRELFSTYLSHQA